MIRPRRRTLSIALAGFSLLGLVWQHVQATRLGYEVERERRALHALRARLAGLRLELEREQAPARLARSAQERLGMFPAGPEALRRLPPQAASPARTTLLGRIVPKSWMSLASALDT